MRRMPLDNDERRGEGESEHLQLVCFSIVHQERCQHRLVLFKQLMLCMTAIRIYRSARNPVSKGAGAGA